MSKSLNQGMHNHITFPRSDKVNGTDILDSADQNFCAISGMASQSVVELQNKLQVLFTYIPLASFYDHPLSPPIRKHNMLSYWWKTIGGRWCHTSSTGKLCFYCGSLVVVGGSYGSTRSTTIHLYQPERKKWTKVGDLPTERRHTIPTERSIAQWQIAGCCMGEVRIPASLLDKLTWQLFWTNIL